MLRKFFLLLVLLLTMTVIVACSDDSSTADDQNTQDTNNGEVNDDNGNQTADDKTPDNQQQDEKPTYWSEDGANLKLFLASHASWPYQDEWPIWDWIKEKTNITIEGQPPSGEYADKLSITMASGNLPDLFNIWSGDDSKYGQAGAFVDLTKHLDKMPNLKKFWEENPDVRSRATLPDGAVYLAIAEGSSFSNQRAWQYREDVFEENGLEVPTTWDELYDVSKKLKEIYPDSFPLVFRGGIGAFGNISMSFGTYNNYFPDLETREVKFGPTTDEFKALVTRMNTFYDEGLIPPDWLSINTKQWTEYVATDSSFMTVDYIGRIDYFNNMFTEGKGRQMAYMKPPAGAGSPGYVIDAYYNSEGLAVAATSENMDAAFKYIDFLYSDEGIETMSWGEEGQTFVNENGEKKIVDTYISFDDLRVKTGMGTYGTYGYFNPEAAYSMMNDEQKEVYETISETAYPEKIVKPTFTKEEQEVMSVEGEAVKKHYEEEIAKFIIGDRSLDEYDQFISELEDLGLQKVIDTYTVAWKRQGTIE
ncbi:extracellular solute-binding protein [Radiobacillus sp. PE A8.2]|uniref:extracellular solute-binding protein n=1 Tax=Radiobacillus sp. PE A8.2 TaxID=3380349 RepID=UPI003890242C